MKRPMKFAELNHVGCAAALNGALFPLDGVKVVGETLRGKLALGANKATFLRPSVTSAWSLTKAGGQATKAVSAWSGPMAVQKALSLPRKHW